MLKRGQVTIFVVIGMVILMIVSASIYLSRNSQNKNISEKSSEIQEIDRYSNQVYSFVDHCIEQVGSEAILNVGYNGRKNIILPYAFQNDHFGANYLIYAGEDNTASILETEENIAFLVEEHLNGCVHNFTTLTPSTNPEILNYDLLFEALDIRAGKIDASVKIRENSVSLMVNWPLEVKMEGATRDFSQFGDNNYKVDMKRMTEFTQNFINKLKNDPSKIDALYLLDQNYSVDISAYENDTYLFLITDNRSVIDNQPLRYLFASQLSGRVPG